MNERYDRWIQTIVLCVMLAFVGFTIMQCEINVVEYDGFKNSCEINGGVVYDGRCFGPEVLVDLNNEEKEQ